MWLLFLVSVTQAELEMVPEDGYCLPGEEVLLEVPTSDTADPMDCLWSVEAGLLPQDDDLEGDQISLTCPDCGRRMDAVFQLYAYCTDVDNDAVWYFDEIVVACSEIQDEPEPEGCACAAGASPALWSLLLLPGVVLRRRRARG